MNTCLANDGQISCRPGCYVPRSANNAGLSRSTRGTRAMKKLMIGYQSAIDNLSARTSHASSVGPRVWPNIKWRSYPSNMRNPLDPEDTPKSCHETVTQRLKPDRQDKVQQTSSLWSQHVKWPRQYCRQSLTTLVIAKKDGSHDGDLARYPHN